MEVLTEEPPEQQRDKKSSMVSAFKEEEKGEKDGLGKKYTREEMEALRFVQMDYQLQRFEQVYWGLEPSVKQEFDSIFVPDSKHNKRNRNRNRNKNRNKQQNKALDGDSAGVIVGEEIEATQLGAEDQRHNLKNVKYVDYDISDDDKYDGILKPAFLVEGEPDFESGPPLDGLEYLRRVRWEANQIPDVNIAKLNLSEICAEQTPYMPKIPELPKCPPNLLPSKQWQDSFLTQFSDLRKSFSELEISMNQDQPATPTEQSFSELEISMNQDQPATPTEQIISIEKSPPQTVPNIPTFLTDSILSLHSSFQLEASSDRSLSLQSSSELEISSDQSKQKDSPQESPPRTVPTVRHLLKMDSISRVSTLRNYIDMVESFESLSFDDCLWLFALCASIDQPLNANTCASLRSLLRKCLGIVGKKEERDDEVAMLSVLVIICGRYFGQYDN